jgi:outer membrane protein OmpA-like peptidoglycan-associated protein
MNARWTALVLGVLLGLGSGALARDDPPGATRTAAAAGETRVPVRTWAVDLDGHEWAVRPSAPTTLGDTGLFRLVGSADTLPRGFFSVGLFRDNVDRDPKSTDFAVHGLVVGYGVTDHLEVFGSLGVENRVRALRLDEPGGPNAYPFVSEGWTTGFGDLWLGAKYSFVDAPRGDSVGFALRAFARVPTADAARGLGPGTASLGGDLIVSRSLGDSADLHAVAGYEVNGNPARPETVATLDEGTFPGPDFVANALRWGVGISLPTGRVAQLQAELSGRLYGDTTVPQTHTADLIVGAALWLKPGLYVRPAFVYALGYDGRGQDVSVAKRSGFNLSIGFHGGTPCCEIYTPPPPAPAPASRPPTVSVACEPSPVLPGQVSRCRATASDPDGDPLTYAWSSAAGSISGSNAQGSLDTAGIKAGDCTVVTVKVSDGRGGVAEGTTRVCVQEPPRPKPEAVTCTSGGFPRNLSRLNNVDKACLDDVASRLNQDPRSRVIIVGHADSSERNTEVIGRKRSEAVKDYLVSERGIAESRIAARSAADSKPLDTARSARAGNRRVDVIFVPEGATVPEND